MVFFPNHHQYYSHITVLINGPFRKKTNIVTSWFVFEWWLHQLSSVLLSYHSTDKWTVPRKNQHWDLWCLLWIVFSPIIIRIILISKYWYVGRPERKPIVWPLDVYLNGVFTNHQQYCSHITVLINGPSRDTSNIVTSWCLFQWCFPQPSSVL